MHAVLQELRARLGAYDSPNSRKAPLPFSALPNGLPRGILTEITGPGKTENVARLLAENSTLRVAWIESHFSLFPSALLQRGVSLEKIFFITAGKDSAWAATSVLRAQIFPIVVYHAPYGCERELRRFQLLAERSASTMILLAAEPAERAWPIRLSLLAAGRKLSIVRSKA